MGMNNLGNIFSEPEARYKAQVVHATFGHLDPKPGCAYRGAITVAVGWSGKMIMKYKFRGLVDSPLLGMTLTDILDRVPDVDSGVYVWIGYLVRFKNGKAKLTKGTLKRCRITHGMKVLKLKPEAPNPAETAVTGHEYLVQGHGVPSIADDTARYAEYEVLDLTQNGKVVFIYKTYQGCNNWIDGLPLDAPRND